MRRTPARRVEPGSALWRGFLASGSSGHDFMRSLSSPRRKVQLPYIIQCIKTAGKLATTSVEAAESRHQLAHHLVADGVQLFRTVQRDRCDVVVAVVHDILAIVG